MLGTLNSNQSNLKEDQLHHAAINTTNTKIKTLKNTFRAKILMSNNP